MAKRFLLMIILAVFTWPALALAVGMGGFVDEVYIHTKTVGTVVYTHNIHGANCAACHPKVFKKKNNSNHVNMKAMERGKSCGHCHNGRKAFSVKANCTRCHAGDIIYRNADEGNVTFPHAAHLENFACDDCHPDLFKAKRGANKLTMEDMEAGKGCGSCHDGDGAFNVAEDCESCHKQ